MSYKMDREIPAPWPNNRVRIEQWKRPGTWTPGVRVYALENGAFLGTVHTIVQPPKDRRPYPTSHMVATSPDGREYHLRSGRKHVIARLRLHANKPPRSRVFYWCQDRLLRLRRGLWRR